MGHQNHVPINMKHPGPFSAIFQAPVRTILTNDKMYVLQKAKQQSANMNNFLSKTAHMK